MTLLLKDRETAPAVDAPPPSGEQPEPVASHPCEACGAGMRADQDWCLECGTAAPGRLGARPGWRAATTVLGLTLLLLTGAVAASYAALTSDAQRDASRPSAGRGEPIIAQAPGVGQSTTPVTPGATGPGTTAPKPRAVPPVRAVPAPKPVPGATSSSGGSSSSSTGSSGGGGSSSPSSPSRPQTVKLSSNAATTYDPAKRAGAEFGPARYAVDSSRQTVWDVTVPADQQPIGAGLAIDLGASYSLASLTIDTPLDGFDVELYGARGSKLPRALLDDRWENLVDRADYVDGSAIKLKGRGDGKVRFINLWFTKPRDAEDPRVAIANVTVTATK